MDRKELPASILDKLTLFRLTLKGFTFNKKCLEQLIGEKVNAKQEMYIKINSKTELPVTIDNELMHYAVIYTDRTLKY